MSVIIPAKSELWNSIWDSIDHFNFGDYGFDEVEETKRDFETLDWMHDLATKIEEDWVRHVDGY